MVQNRQCALQLASVVASMDTSAQRALPACRVIRTSRTLKTASSTEAPGDFVNHAFPLPALSLFDFKAEKKNPQISKTNSTREVAWRSEARPRPVSKCWRCVVLHVWVPLRSIPIGASTTLRRWLWWLPGRSNHLQPPSDSEEMGQEP